MGIALLQALALTLPLSAEKIETYLAERPATTLEEFLGALPPSLNENFVLLHASRSLHQATPEAPRQILFGSDARFLVAASGVATDPRFQLLEFAEFDAAAGHYRFGTVDFSEPGSPQVEKDVARCQGCHGSPPRPIWGEYPRWGGAYGDEAGIVAPELQASFSAFVKASSENPRYRNLIFAKDETGRTFKLSARYYAYPNTDFNHELGNTVALAAMTRLTVAPDYARWRAALLGVNPTMSCIDSDAWTTLTRKVSAAYAAVQDRFPPTTRVDVKALRLLGFDPVREFSLEVLAGHSGRASAGQYQTGAFRIEEALAFQLLQDLMQNDAVLRSAFASEREMIDFIAGKARLVGEERAAALRRSSSWFLFFDVFDPVTESERRLNGVCERLAELTGFIE